MKFYDRLLFSCPLLGEQSSIPLAVCPLGQAGASRQAEEQDCDDPNGLFHAIPSFVRVQGGAGAYRFSATTFSM